MNNRTFLKKIIWFLFIIYISWLIYFLLFCERYGRQTFDCYWYNTVPFSEIKRYIQHMDSIGIEYFMINIVGNVLAFIPFGASLPLINKRYKGFFAVISIGLLFIVTIETFQLIFRVGSFDVDDIMLNTTGVVLGYIVSIILKCVYNHRKKDN